MGKNSKKKAIKRTRKLSGFGKTQIILIVVTLVIVIASVIGIVAFCLMRGSGNEDVNLPVETVPLEDTTVPPPNQPDDSQNPDEETIDTEDPEGEANPDGTETTENTETSTTEATTEGLGNTDTPDDPGSALGPEASSGDSEETDDETKTTDGATENAFTEQEPQDDSVDPVTQDGITEEAKRIVSDMQLEQKVAMSFAVTPLGLAKTAEYEWDVAYVVADKLNTGYLKYPVLGFIMNQSNYTSDIEYPFPDMISALKNIAESCKAYGNNNHGLQPIIMIGDDDLNYIMGEMNDGSKYQDVAQFIDDNGIDYIIKVFNSEAGETEDTLNIPNKVYRNSNDSSGNRYLCDGSTLELIRVTGIEDIGITLQQGGNGKMLLLSDESTFVDVCTKITDGIDQGTFIEDDLDANLIKIIEFILSNSNVQQTPTT